LWALALLCSCLGTGVGGYGGERSRKGNAWSSALISSCDGLGGLVLLVCILLVGGSQVAGFEMGTSDHDGAKFCFCTENDALSLCNAAVSQYEISIKRHSRSRYSDCWFLLL
jgi:hypothetical protein